MAILDKQLLHKIIISLIAKSEYSDELKQQINNVIS
jgi:hypothetical protein